MPFFSIITPTYKRVDKLQKAIDSVLNQSYQNFEMIIVNDSPNDESYKNFENNISDPRIIYLKNEKNSGVNFSRNRGLDSISPKAEWVIFLDDDDTLAKDTLQTFVDLIKKNENEKWFVCNRATTDGKSLTKSPKNNSHINYAWDYLITKRFKGDATHCIKKELLKNNYFPKTIKQGDEWLFFYELSLRTQFFYHNFNATLTDGYSDDGLNFRKRTIAEQLNTLKLLIKEGVQRKIFWHLTFIMYIKLRFLRAFIK